MTPPTTQPQQRELPEAIETALTATLDALVECEELPYPEKYEAEAAYEKARVTLIAAIARELDAARADSKRLDAWERERWNMLQTDMHSGMHFGILTRDGAAYVGLGPTLREAIDAATKPESP